MSDMFRAIAVVKIYDRCKANANIPVSANYAFKTPLAPSHSSMSPSLSLPLSLIHSFTLPSLVPSLPLSPLSVHLTHSLTPSLFLTLSLSLPLPLPLSLILYPSPSPSPSSFLSLQPSHLEKINESEK